MLSQHLARGAIPQQPDAIPPEIVRMNFCKSLYRKDFEAASTFGQNFSTVDRCCLRRHNDDLVISMCLARVLPRTATDRNPSTPPENWQAVS
jgi:hypothetical protein